MVDETNKNDTYLLDVDAAYTDANKIGYENLNGEGASVRRIYLQGTKITYNLNSYIQVSQIPNATNASLSYGDFLGFQNPSITVEGTISLEDDCASTETDADGDYAPTVTYVNTSGTTVTALKVTLKWLQEIVKSGHTFELIDLYDYNEENDTTKYWRVHSTSSSARSSIKVKCKSATMDTTTQTEEGQGVHYVLNFVEVNDG